MPKENKIIQFPTPNRSLQRQQQVEKLMKEEEYVKALKLIDSLLTESFHVITNNLYKLTCLQHLNDWKQIEDLSQQLLENDTDKNYFRYLLFYVTSLYHQEQYELIVETIRTMKQTREIPDQIESKLHVLFKQSEKKIQQQSDRILQQFQLAIASNDTKQQWILLNQWKRLQVTPPTEMIQMLSLETVHPIIKTEWIDVFQESRLDIEVTIQKFMNTITISLQQLPKRKHHPIYVAVEDHLQSIQRTNLTIAAFMNELFEHYSIVHFPFFFQESEMDDFVAALEIVALRYYHTNEKQDGTEKTEIKNFINEIENSHQMYLSLVYL